MEIHLINKLIERTLREDFQLKKAMRVRIYFNSKALCKHRTYLFLIIHLLYFLSSAQCTRP